MGSGQMGMGMHRSSLTVETLAASKQDRLKVSSSGAWSVAENRQLKLEFDSGMRMEQMVKEHKRGAYAIMVHLKKLGWVPQDHIGSLDKLQSDLARRSIPVFSV